MTEKMEVAATRSDTDPTSCLARGQIRKDVGRAAGECVGHGGLYVEGEDLPRRLTCAGPGAGAEGRDHAAERRLILAQDHPNLFLHTSDVRCRGFTRILPDRCQAQGRSECFCMLISVDTFRKNRSTSRSKRTRCSSNWSFREVCNSYGGRRTWNGAMLDVVSIGRGTFAEQCFASV